MRLVTFRNSGGETRLGGLIDNDSRVVDFRTVEYLQGSRESACLRDMQSLIESGGDGLALAAEYCREPLPRACLAVRDVTLLAPLPVPTQLRCFSVFETHARQSGQAMMRYMASQSANPDAALQTMRESGKFDVPAVFYERPFYYKGNRFSVTGTDTDIHWPPYSDIVDYEVELAAVIGRKGRDIKREDAASYLFGYTVFNDLSARDEQAREMVAPLGPAKGKDFDGGNVIGPCIVTADELTDPYALRLQASVNDEAWTDSHSSGMTHTFEAMIGYVSRSETIYPGELFVSGCAGDGCGLELGRYPKRGDTIAVSIESIGTIRNRIV